MFIKTYLILVKIQIQNSQMMTNYRLIVQIAIKRAIIIVNIKSNLKLHLLTILVKIATIRYLLVQLHQVTVKINKI